MDAEASRLPNAAVQWSPDPNPVDGSRRMHTAGKKGRAGQRWPPKAWRKIDVL